MSTGRAWDSRKIVWSPSLGLDAVRGNYPAFTN